MPRIKVYAQFAMTAEYATEFETFGDAEKQTCQNLANRLQAEVRAMRGDTIMAEFLPQGEHDGENENQYEC
jgi:hypothetical protein